MGDKFGPLSLTFDEPLDVDTVTPVSVTLSFDNNATTTHTVNLSADGTELMVDFDRDTVPTPYTATIQLNGVTDLAGNAQASLDYTVSAWRAEAIATPAGDFEFFVLGGKEFLAGTVQGSPDDRLRIWERGAQWNQIVDESLSQVYDIDVDVEGDVAHIAVLHRGSEQGLVVKKASLFEFAGATGILTAGGAQVVGPDGDNGAIAIDVRSGNRGTNDVVAAVSDGRVRVFKTVNRLLSLNTQNSFPSVDYDFARDENLEVHVRQDGSAEVMFARCMTNSSPCERTRVDRLVETGGSWGSAGTILTPSSATSGDCDEFDYFETSWSGDVPKLLMSYYGPCGSASAVVLAREGGATGFTSIVSGIMGSNPGVPTNTRYTTHVAVDDAGNVFALLGSGSQLLPMALSGSIDWLPEVGEGLETRGAANRIGEKRIFLDATGAPLVVFQHQNNVRLYRRN